MATLEERMSDNLMLAAAVMNREISNREVARTFDIDESVVRRWRNRNIVDPQPQAAARPVTLMGEQTVISAVGFDFSKERTEAVTLPEPVDDSPAPTDLELLELVGADPEQWEVTGRKESTWQNAGGQWLRSHKVELGRRITKSGDLSVEQISQILERYNTDVSPDWTPNGRHMNGVFVVPIADLQAGKIDGGGTAALVDRFGRIVQEVREELEREGGCDLLIIPVLGDCIEGLVAMGGKMVTRLDISVTEQVRVYRRLLAHIIAELAPYAHRVIVPVIPGNHDENYRMVDQPVTDSWAIEGASAVADAMADNPKYQKVSFIFPETEELVITLNVGSQAKPYILGFTHGHLAKTPNSVEDWWSKQAFGQQQAGNADILFTGHFHHLRTEMMGKRTWIQAPALDGGSDYYRRKAGTTGVAGMISMWVTPGQGIGWEGLTVHTGE